MKIVQLVDSNSYIHNNCFQHQLSISLKRSHNVTTVELSQLSGKLPPHDVIISCLKLRTLLRNIVDVSLFLKGSPVVVYDQDVWEGFHDKSQFKGAYEIIMSRLNVSTFAVTSKWWSDFIKAKGFPSKFVKMWLLPEYCNVGQRFESRAHSVGFIGGLHPRRRALIDEINMQGISVNTSTVNLGYVDFLRAISNIGIFVHNEDQPMTVDGFACNMGTGMWAKDIETAGRGCFSVRNKADSWETYLSDIPSVVLFDDKTTASDVIKKILTMNSDERWEIMNKSVSVVRDTDGWAQTVKELVEK
jgi:hypothetical protein